MKETCLTANQITLFNPLDFACVCVCVCMKFYLLDHTRFSLGLHIVVEKQGWKSPNSESVTEAIGLGFGFLLLVQVLVDL